MKKKMMIVAFEIIINIVFGIVIAVLVVIIINCEFSTLLGQTLSGVRVLDTAVDTIVV